MKKLVFSLVFVLFVYIQSNAQLVGRPLLDTTHHVTSVKAYSNDYKILGATTTPYLFSLDLCGTIVPFTGITDPVLGLFTLQNTLYAYTKTQIFSVTPSSGSASLVQTIDLSAKSPFPRALAIRNVTVNEAGTRCSVVGDFNTNDTTTISQVFTWDGTNAITPLPVPGNFSPSEVWLGAAISQGDSLISVCYTDGTIVPFNNIPIAPYYTQLANKFRTFHVQTQTWKNDSFFGHYPTHFPGTFYASYISQFNSMCYFEGKLTIYADFHVAYPYIPDKDVLQYQSTGLMEQLYEMGGDAGDGVTPLDGKLSVFNNKLYLVGCFSSSFGPVNYYSNNQWHTLGIFSNTTPSYTTIGMQNNPSIMDIDPLGNIIIATNKFYEGDQYGNSIISISSVYEFGSSLPSTAVCTQTGIADISHPEILLYPNPATDVLSLQGIPARDIVTVTNVLGQQILTMAGTGETISFSLASIPSGMYIVKAKDFSKTFVKQ